MKKVTKRLLAVMLALVLCLSLLPGVTMAADVYAKVTDVSDITSGGQFVLVAGNYAMTTAINDKAKFPGAAVTPNGDTLSGNSLPVWTIEAVSGGIALSVDGQYLGYESGTNFVMQDTAYTWNITAGDNGFTVIAAADETRGIFYQNQYTRFGVYSTKNTSGYVTELQLYKLSEGESGGSDPIEPSKPESGMTPAEIVDAAYALEVGASMAEAVTLKGKIVSIDTPYNSQYSNITVTIAVEGKEDKPIQCFRLKGTGADTLAVGDTITVTGILKNYNGTIEFDAGCSLDAVEKGDGPVVEAPEDPKEIVDAAYALAPGAVLPYEATLTGKVTEIVDAYNEQYGNITVNFVVEGKEDKPILCYRMKGTGADTLAVGDIITVTGNLKNYSKTDSETGVTTNTIEFTPCTFVKDGGEPTMTPAEIVDAAYELEEGASMEEAVTLTGKIVSVDTPYSSQYNNISVNMAVAGREDKPILCFRLKGDGVDQLAEGDTITVTGKIKNHYGTIEFAAGCTLDSYIKGENEVIPAPEDPKEIVDAAYALAPGAVLPYEATLTGKVTEIVEAYNEEYSNITVNMVIEGREDKPIQCYRMKGEGADTLAVGDTITVTGNLKNYAKTDSETGVTTSTIEFTPCTLIAVVKAPTGVTVSGAVVTGAEGDTTIELIAGEEVVATATASGKEGTYSIEDVAAGTYTLKVSKLNHVTREYTVTVGAEDLTQDVKIHLIGDIDGNGRVNMGDVIKLNAHVKAITPITDEYELLCANVNGGTINTGDTSRLYAHVKGTVPLY